MRKWLRHTFRVLTFKARREERMAWLGQTFNLTGHISMVFDNILTIVTIYLLSLHTAILTTAYFTLTLNLPDIQQLAISGIAVTSIGWWLTGASYVLGNYYYGKLLKAKRRPRKK